MSPDDRVTGSVEDSIQHLCKEVETSLRGLVHELLRSAGEDRLTAVREARGTAEAEAARLLSSELARARAESAERLASQLARHRSEASETLATEVERGRAETTKVLEAEFGRQRAEVAQVTADDLERLRAEAAEAMVAELSDARAEAAQMLAAEVGRVQADAAAAAAADLGRAQAQAARTLETEVTSARVEERQAVLEGLDRMLGSMRRLDGAHTLTEVLNALADAVSEEAARVAMFVAQGAHIHGWRFSGFGPDAPDARGFDLVTTETGIIAQAIETGETCSVPARAGGSEPAGPHFAQLPEGRVALAVPLRLGGRTVAVVYADDTAEGIRPVPAAWPEAIEILVRHAGRCLEALTAMKTSLTGAYRGAVAAPARAQTPVA